MTADTWIEGLRILGHVAQHGGEGDPFTEWDFHPSIVIGTILLLGVYLYAVGPLRRRYHLADSIDKMQIAMFLIGTAVLFLSLCSPLDILSDDYLFSAHMVQHIFLSVIVPLFFILGTPGWLIRPMLKSPAVARVARFLTSPATAFLLFNVNFWLWHLPFLYDLAVANEQIHIFQHLTFMSTGVLNWWPVLSPVEELPRLSYPRQLIYLALNCQPNVVLGAILFFSHGVLYQSYLDAPRLFDLSPYADQQIGGLIMWVPENAFYSVVFSIICIKWLMEGETDFTTEAR